MFHHSPLPVCEALIIKGGACIASWAAIGSERVVERWERKTIQKSGENAIMVESAQSC